MRQATPPDLRCSPLGICQWAVWSWSLVPPRLNPNHKVSTVTACVVQAEGLGVLLSTGLGTCVLWNEVFYT